MKDLQIAVPSKVPAVAMLRSLADQLESMQPVAIIDLRTQSIGAPWDGQHGVYAGIARGMPDKSDPLAPDYPLIVGEYLQGRMTWQAALEAAKKFGDGCWRVPTKREAALCYANVPELFEKEWHWLSEPYEGYADCAWAQGFRPGDQYGYHEGYEFRVRLVRTVSVID